MLLDPAGDATREPEGGVERRQRLVGLLDVVGLEEPRVHASVHALRGQDQHSRGESVQPVGRRELGQVQGVPQPDQYRLSDVRAVRGGGQEVGLVDHDDAGVLVQHLDGERHDRLRAQRSVEPDERVRTVRLLAGPGLPRLVDELPGVQPRIDRDGVREAVDEEVAHRGPSGGGGRIAVRRPHPRRVQPLPLGQWRSGRHHATGPGPDEVTTSRVRTQPRQRSHDACPTSATWSAWPSIYRGRSDHLKLGFPGP